DYRVSAAVLLLAGGLGAVAVFNVTTSSRAHAADDDAGKVTRAAVTPDLTTAQSRDMVECPPPVPRSRFITELGFFELPEWDSRNLTDAEKAANPWPDPFWPAFVGCLQDAGVGIGLTTPVSATQADIDRLVDVVN